MALIDAEEFERGKLEAAAEWQKRKQPKLAAAFAAMTLEKCGFGMDPRGRICWATIDGVKVFLAFDIETGAYKGSSVLPGAGPSAPPAKRS